MNRHLGLGFLLFAAATTTGTAEPEDTEAMAEARKMGVTVVQLFNEKLRLHDGQPELPGIHAWLTGPARTFDKLDKDRPTAEWRKLKADDLVTGNPAFWQMHYEVAPADPGLTMLHAGALLAAGDCYRCDAVLRIALHQGKVDKSIREMFRTLFYHSNQFRNASNQMVAAGVGKHDAKDFKGALADYDRALALWPQNGWAHYERGHTLRSVTSAGSPEEDPEVIRAFAQSRRFQPFQLAAWQGIVKDVPGLQNMILKVLPIWEKSTKSLDHLMTDDELTEFGEVLQEAELDDLALVAQQVVVHRRGRYNAEDHPFFVRSLRRLAPGKETDATLETLAGKSFTAIRLLSSD